MFVKGLLIKGFEVTDKVRTYLKQVDLRANVFESSLIFKYFWTIHLAS